LDRGLDYFNLVLRNIDINDMNDLKFCVNAWLKGYNASKVCEQIPHHIYNHYQRKIILYLLSHKHTKILCSKTDPLHKGGFINYEVVDGIYCLHYIYIIKSYKQFGLGEQLLQASGWGGSGVYSHTTWVMGKFGSKFNLFYNPYILMEVINDNDTKVQDVCHSSYEGEDGEVL